MRGSGFRLTVVPKCKGCLETTWKACHGTERSVGLSGRGPRIARSLGASGYWLPFPGRQFRTNSYNKNKDQRKADCDCSRLFLFWESLWRSGVFKSFIFYDVAEVICLL